MSVAGFTACLARYGGTDNKLGNGFGVFFLYLFVTFFGGSMDASSYVYSSEIFPTSIRAQGAGFSVSGLFCFSLIYTMCAPVAFNSIGWKYYLIFIIVPIFGAAMMYLFYPEVSSTSISNFQSTIYDKCNADFLVRRRPKAWLSKKLQRSLATRLQSIFLTSQLKIEQDSIRP